MLFITYVAKGMPGSAMIGLPKTRMRTSFDPEFELPRLQRWFSENQHPTRLQVMEGNGIESGGGNGSDGVVTGVTVITVL